MQGSAKPEQEIFSMQGKLSSQLQEDKLMHSVLENDKQTIQHGKLLKEALNLGHRNIMPELLYENLVKNYRMAEKLYGKTLLKLITGHSPEYLKKNLKIPEFRKTLKSSLLTMQAELKSKGLITEEGITDMGMELAGLLLYVEELEELMPKGRLTGKLSKLKSPYGVPDETTPFKRETPFRDIDIKATVKLAARRLHSHIHEKDIVARARLKQSLKWIIFILDSSGSMRAQKMDFAKKAGVALAYKAIDEGNRIGLVVFSSDVTHEQPPTNDFRTLLRKITPVSPKKSTNIAQAIRKAVTMFPRGNHTKHIIAITDALPTFGKQPIKDTLKEVSNAQAQGISISLVGVDLSLEGENIAKQITELGQGRLYAIKELKNLDRIVLMDYYLI